MTTLYTTAECCAMCLCVNKQIRPKISIHDRKLLMKHVGRVREMVLQRWSLWKPDSKFFSTVKFSFGLLLLFQCIFGTSKNLQDLCFLCFQQRRCPRTCGQVKAGMCTLCLHLFTEPIYLLFVCLGCVWWSQKCFSELLAGIGIYQTCPYLNYRPGGTVHETRFLGRGGAFNISRSIIHEEVHAKALKWDLH